MNDMPLHVRFPCESFLSQGEFDLYCKEQQPALDARFAYEQSLAAAASPLREGTCAPCLRPAQFQAGGRSAPNWRDEQECDCADRLSNRARAMLHWLESVAGLGAWSRLLLFGPPSPLDQRFAQGRPAPKRLPRLLLVKDPLCPGRYRLDAPDAAFTHAVSWDYLHRIPPLPAALAEVRRTLAPGGQFVFTIPFHYRAARTLSRLGHVPRRGGQLPAEFRGEIHDIGWDILDILAEAGFADARALTYWSEELGYLGPFNMLFAASA